MTPTTSSLLKLFAACATAAALLGCGPILAPTPDRTKFYLLTPADSAPALAASSLGSDFTLGLGPVKVPPYLDRPEVVTRAAPNRLELSKADRWGESLQTSFTTVLSRDLGAQLGTHQILVFPWYSTSHIDLQVEIDVYRFETDAKGDAQLSARWTILNPADKSILYSAESNLTQPSKPGDTTDAAAALSRTLADFSREIANMVTQVRAQQGAKHNQQSAPR
jgi:uncharacterized lipoprotein YmbA